MCRGTAHTTRARLRAGAVLGALLALSLCAAAVTGWRTASAETAAGQEDAVVDSATGGCTEHLQVRLFFGLSTPAGLVSEAEWTRFLADVITPRFPRGLTVMHADGQWRAPGRTDVVREPSHVVEIVDPGGPDVDRRLSEIVAVYRQRFQQDSVLLTRGRIEACY